MLGFQLFGMIEAGSGQHLGKRFQRVAVIVEDPFGLVRHHQRTLAQRVLGGHAGRAFGSDANHGMARDWPGVA